MALALGPSGRKKLRKWPQNLGEKNQEKVYKDGKKEGQLMQ